MNISTLKDSITTEQIIYIHLYIHQTSIEKQSAIIKGFSVNY